MTSTSTELRMLGRQGCPSFDALERLAALESAGGSQGTGDLALTRHVESCAECLGNVQLIRENMDFMRGVRAIVGDGSELGGLGVTAGAGGGAGAGGLPPRFVPQPLPGYRIEREIARGGQGVVYEGLQLETKRKVAIKIIETAGRGERGRRRIEREAELAASLRHPNVVGVYQSTLLADGRHALVMEYVDGTPLDEWTQAVDASAELTRDGSREAVRRKVRALAAACEGVHHAHVNGVIHRDLKPANVLVTEGDVPRVVDFGVARRVAGMTGGERESGAGCAQGLSQITLPGGFAGTLAYSSPEQVAGNAAEVDTRADVYALGMMLYEVLTGRRAYDTGGSLSSALTNITQSPPAPLGTLKPGGQSAGSELQAIVSKALAKERSARYQSAAAMKADLDNWLDGRPVEARQQSTGYVLGKLARRHWVAVSVGVAMFALLAAFTVALAYASRRDATQRNQLAEALTSSMIERGRLVGMSGANTRAEALLWPELLRSGADLKDPYVLFASSPSAMQASWSMVELMARYPSRLNVPVGPDETEIVYEPIASATPGTAGWAARLVKSDFSTRLIDLSDGRLLASTPAPLNKAWRSPRLSHARNRVTARSDDGSSVMWLDVCSLTHGRLPNIGDDQLHDLSCDGSRLLTVGSNKTLRLWDVQSGALVRTLASGLEYGTGSSFTEDGKLALSGIGDTVSAWSAEDGTPISAWLIPAELRELTVSSPIRVTRLRPDKKQLAVSLHGSILLVPMGEDVGKVYKIVAHRGMVSHLQYSPDGSVLLSTGNDFEIRTWDTATGQMLVAFEQPSSGPQTARMSDDGRLVAVRTIEGTLRVLETRASAWRSKLVGPVDSVTSVKFSGDGQVMAGASADGQVRVWRVSDHQLVWSSNPVGCRLGAVCLSKDGSRIYAGGFDGILREYELGGTADPVRTISSNPWITWIGTLDGGRTIAVGARTSIQLFDAEKGTPSGELLGHDIRLIEAATSQDGKLLASVGQDGVCIVRDAISRAERFRTPALQCSVRAVAFSPDDRLMVTGSDDWRIRVWDARSGELLRTIEGVRQHVFALAFHPLGNVLFSACRDAGVQVWDVRTGRELAVLEGHSDIVLSLAISPDGRWLGTGSADRSAALWDLSYYLPHLRGTALAWQMGKDPTDITGSTGASLQALSAPAGTLPDTKLKITAQPGR